MFPEQAYLIRLLIMVMGPVLLWWLQKRAREVPTPEQKELIEKHGHLKLLVGQAFLVICLGLILYGVLAVPWVWEGLRKGRYRNHS